MKPYYYKSDTKLFILFLNSSLSKTKSKVVNLIIYIIMEQ